ncbi:MAG: hypothetical protein DRJ62_07635 [Thermoprotei archaeon]|nr:MAG: hypothetical protein DRJ62_07635 [Thermoprotei archaeon]
MLKSMTIRNLRGIKECIIKDLNEVNILIRKNGSGKSTILEAIYLASAWINLQDSQKSIIHHPQSRTLIT